MNTMVVDQMLCLLSKDFRVSDGKLTLLDQNKVLQPNPHFRIFGTCNTLGSGDESGLYYGTQNLNQGQLGADGTYLPL